MTFDLETYRKTARPVATDDLDFEAFRRFPLDENVLRCIRFMHDVESHTVCYLRDLLMTASHKDPSITTFLTMWNYEEYWHGVALGRVLDAHGEMSEAERIAPMRRRLGVKDKISPLTNALASAALGEHFIAVHMSWGAVNEWSTRAGYERLAARAGHPVLTELLRRISQQETRHIAFYASQARRRLAHAAVARRATRFALQRLWAPVGSGVMPEAETQFLLRYLMGGRDGLAAARRIDASIDKLPGLSGLGLVAGAVQALGDGPTQPGAHSADRAAA